MNLLRDLALNVSGDGRVLLIISRHGPSLSCPRLATHIRKTDGHPFIRVAASFSACWVLLLRFRGSRLDGVLLGAQSLGVVLFLCFFLVDDHCEELLHLLGHAGR